MPKLAIHPHDAANLRLRALSRLGANATPQGGRASASEALRVLYDLASAPGTAPDALALLHELQVHQLELDLQDEELRRSRAELETALLRQSTLYNYAPIGCFTVESNTALCELNLTGARLLGFERDAVLGRGLDTFLTLHSARALHALLERVAAGQQEPACRLELLARAGQPSSTPRVVYARASVDPDGPRFFVAFVEVSEQ